MIAMTQNTHLADTARNCALLLERIAEKFGVEELPKQNPRARVRGVTPADLAKVRAEGLMVLNPPPSHVPAWTFSRKSLLDANPTKRRLAKNPNLAKAVAEVLDLSARNGGKLPRGEGKRIAAKFGLHYGYMMDAVSIERMLARGKERAA